MFPQWLKKKNISAKVGEKFFYVQLLVVLVVRNGTVRPSRHLRDCSDSFAACETRQRSVN
jgi:hypothetical protein